MSTVPANSVACIANCLLQLRSSTDYNADHGAKNSLLNFANSTTDKNFTVSNSWSSAGLDKNQFIMAGSDAVKEFVAISTQGRGDNDQWVTSYIIRYSLDNINWFEYNNSQVFNANTDRNSIVTHTFNPPIKARSIAVHPQSYHISLRWEVYSKPLDTTNHNSFVQVGTVSIGDRSLNQGNGDRKITRKVVFPKAFGSIPKVAIGSHLIDAQTDNGQMRWRVDAANITNTGFDCVFNTWGSNCVYDIIVDYIALEN
ncbi:hypothetical protein CYY_005319 [Polysphondylium violaceum]|uniref:F5/8 type C domain-containing protein n=1 Tax=Polysphondylium violaceum TaxID=133409 RepID=A0A8J4PWU7_9MYCE|nr:hypothetical protein CYY_005319 [Polysphondylium violaceum]